MGVPGKPAPPESTRVHVQSIPAGIQTAQIVAAYTPSGYTDDDEQPLLNYTGAFVLYPRRWVMLAMVVLTTLSNVMMWISFSPVADKAEAYYHTSSTVIDLLSTTFLINFVVLSLPSSWLINAKGLRFALILGSFLNMTGSVVRALGDYTATPESKLGVLFVGQVIAAASQPIIVSCPTVLAAMWFGESERGIANMIGSVSNPVGVAMGTVLSAQLVTSTSDIRLMLWVYAAPCVVAFLLIVFFFEARPPTPPSTSAGQKSEPFFRGLKMLLRNKPYLLLVLSFGTGVGATSSVSALSGQIVGGQGFSDKEAGYFFAILLLAGIVGAAISGKIIDKTKRFTETLRVSFGFATLAFLMFTLVLPLRIFWLVSISTGLMGFFCFAALPVALELSVEASYPVGESTSAGIMWMTGQIFGIIITFTMDGLKKDHPAGSDITQPDMTNSCWFVTSMAGLAAFLLLFFKTKYHRLSIDQSAPTSPNYSGTTTPIPYD
jgi:MFS transporter, FLVCR family, MFS-domain-containing protein 7